MPAVTESFKHDFAFLPRARRAYDALDAVDHAAIDRLVQPLCDDPGVDGIT